MEKDEASIASISLEDERMPSREEMFKVMGYQETNIALSEAESDGEYEGILNRIGTSNHFSMSLDKSKRARPKLCGWKLYLDRCTTHHLVFAEWCGEKKIRCGSVLQGPLQPRSDNLQGTRLVWDLQDVVESQRYFKLTLDPTTGGRWLHH